MLQLHLLMMQRLVNWCRIQPAKCKNWTVKGQYSQNTTEFTTAKVDYEAQQIIVGADYVFSKQVKAYGYAGYLTLEQGSLETKQPVVGTGVEYKF